MGDRQVGEAELLRRVLASELSELHVATAGRVQAFDRDAQTADVVPQVWPAGEELPVLPAVPVGFPRSAARGLAWDLAPGDPGLLVFGEADLGQWRQTGEPGPPADRGRHSLQSAVFLPGLHPRGGETTIPAGALVLFGADCRLGGATATEHLVKGDLFAGAMGTGGPGGLSGTLGAWASAVDVAVFGGGSPSPTLTNLLGAIAAVQAGLAGPHLTTKTKAE